MTDRIHSSPEPEQAISWRQAVLALAVTWLAVVVLYRETAMAMVDLWSSSETFTHGFLVPPISLWLIWRIRHDLARLAPRPNLWALILLAGVGFGWLLGELAAVGVVAQFAFTAMLVLSVPAVLGVRVAREMTFPLAFLFFAVPFGEFALPQMMEWTASFTIFALRLTGIPVFREGLQFVIPSGHWSVVEACSGVRYLIASFVVGTLFAYLTYQSTRRRVIFAFVSLLVPLVANWLRAYMIVMLGHLSGNKLAVGVDHLIYGWVFFGVVVMLMFWIGARWREDEVVPQVRQARGDIGVQGPGGSTLFAAMTVIAVTSLWPILEWRIRQDVSPPVVQIEEIQAVPGWRGADGFTTWKPRFENASAVVQRGYSKGEHVVGLYIAYYRNQDYDRKMVSSTNVMVTSNDPVWARVASGTKQIELGSQSLTVRNAELRSYDSSRMVVWQWYWVNGHLTASDHLAKVYTAWSRLTGQGDDSAVIFAFAPKAEGEAALADFVKVADSAIELSLSRTRDRR